MAITLQQLVSDNFNLSPDTANALITAVRSGVYRNKYTTTSRLNKEETQIFLYKMCEGALAVGWENGCSIYLLDKIKDFNITNICTNSTLTYNLKGSSHFTTLYIDGKKFTTTNEALCKITGKDAHGISMAKTNLRTGKSLTDIWLLKKGERPGKDGNYAPNQYMTIPLDVMTKYDAICIRNRNLIKMWKKYPDFEFKDLNPEDFIGKTLKDYGLE